MDRQKGTRTGKMEDRKEERERGEKEQRKNATCREGNNNCYTPLTVGGGGGEKSRNQLLTEDCTSQ